MSFLSWFFSDEIDLEDFDAHLMEYEGYERFPYEDLTGNLSIGYGRNLKANGVSREEAYNMLSNDRTKALEQAARLPYWSDLSSNRKLAVGSLIFNLGAAGFRKFVGANAALAEGDWELAAQEIEWKDPTTKTQNTDYWVQTGRRAREIARLIREG